MYKYTRVKHLGIQTCLLINEFMSHFWLIPVIETLKVSTFPCFFLSLLACLCYLCSEMNHKGKCQQKLNWVINRNACTHLYILTSYVAAQKSEFSQEHLKSTYNAVSFVTPTTGGGPMTQRMTLTSSPYMESEVKQFSFLFSYHRNMFMKQLVKAKPPHTRIPWNFRWTVGAPGCFQARTQSIKTQ